MIVKTPTEQYNTLNKDLSLHLTKIFLAGTIDKGNSENWQQDVINELALKTASDNIIIYNPRRNEWPEDNNEIEKQIKWEQFHLDDADNIIMVLCDNSKSPISLLELGLYAQSGKLTVFCTPKFYRYDNVKLTCEKYQIKLIESLKVKDITNYILSILN